MTREEAIARLNEGEPFSEIFNPEWDEALCMAIKSLEGQEWIPVDNKLPKLEENVLIWTDDGFYEIAHLTHHHFVSGKYIWEPQYNSLGDGVEWDPEEVLAWMPMPKPYKKS